MVSAIEVVGGRGHTTGSLRQAAAARMPGADVHSWSEADIFATYLRDEFGVSVDLLERKSTNCGTNISYALDLVDRHGIPRDSVLIIQDAAMQRRMDAGLRRAAASTMIVNYAAYAPRVEARDGSLCLVNAPDGMWPIDVFVSMLMGEVVRLRDDATGYGPSGRGWIAHVDIPAEVERAYRFLAADGRFTPRTADPRTSTNAATRPALEA